MFCSFAGVLFDCHLETVFIVVVLVVNQCPVSVFCIARARVPGCCSNSVRVCQMDLVIVIE